MSLVTLELAKRHLKVDTDTDDVYIEFQLENASAIVLDYLKITDSTWVAELDSNSDSTAEVTPYPVQAATLLVLGALFADAEGGDPISQAARDLLHRFRDPALA